MKACQRVIAGEGARNVRRGGGARRGTLCTYIPIHHRHTQKPPLLCFKQELRPLNKQLGQSIGSAPKPAVTRVALYAAMHLDFIRRGFENVPIKYVALGARRNLHNSRPCY